MNSTIKRYAVRLVKATKAAECAIKRVESEFTKTGEAAIELGKEFVRPNNKMLEAIAKIIEATTAMHSVLADKTHEAGGIVCQMTKALKAEHDIAGYGQWRDLEEATKEASKIHIEDLDPRDSGSNPN